MSAERKCEACGAIWTVGEPCPYCKAPDPTAARPWLVPFDLNGYTIADASIDPDPDEDAGIVLILHKPGRPDLTCSVMRDPEGNGPGALHVYDALGEFRGIL